MYLFLPGLRFSAVKFLVRPVCVEAQYPLSTLIEPLTGNGDKAEDKTFQPAAGSYPFKYLGYKTYDIIVKMRYESVIIAIISSRFANANTEFSGI
jgi:hypothetical protein